MASEPLTPPTHEPDDEPLVPMLINEEWSTYLVGLIENVKYQSYWDISDEDWPNLVERLDKLQDILQHPD